MSFTVRPATPADAPRIYAFIRELAEYEKLLHAVEASQGDIEQALFGLRPKVFCEIAEQANENGSGGAPIGFALWFYTFSTFRGRHGIYLEDLYISPQARGVGAGKALLAALARRCVEEGLGRLEWAVLDWNAPAIAFYESLGSTPMDEWIVRRLTGEALEALAKA